MRMMQGLGLLHPSEPGTSALARGRRSLEKLNFTKLWRLHDVAVQSNDPEACNYIEDMLDEQAADVKIAAEYVSQLRRVAKGLGVYIFDKTFLADGDALGGGMAGGAAALAGLGAAGVLG